MFTRLWSHRDILLFLFIEADILFGLWPADLHFSEQLLARFAVGSFVWGCVWLKLWRKYCFKPLRRQRRKEATRGGTLDVS